jgi:hypothetical protein
MSGRSLIPHVHKGHRRQHDAAMRSVRSAELDRNYAHVAALEVAPGLAESFRAVVQLVDE